MNRIKGSNLSSLDPDTRELTPPFNPRIQHWTDHFRWNGPLIEPLAAIRRAAAFFLRFNDPVQVEIRATVCAPPCSSVPFVSSVLRIACYSPISTPNRHQNCRWHTG
jgi:hypothetical protein